MSQSHDDLGYSVLRIFLVLFVLTALEVAWGFAFHHNTGLVLHMPTVLFWTGLMLFALVKGLLIFVYFMHMKFERFLVWSLIIPTPALILVILCALMPDLSFNSQRDHPVGDMLSQDGRIVDLHEHDKQPAHHEASATPEAHH
jgi:caa(3)-type oxidase subunit IV